MRRLSVAALAAGLAGLAAVLVSRRASRQASVLRARESGQPCPERRTWVIEEQAKPAWVEVDGLPVHYLQAGDIGSPVLLLHGGGLDSAALTWRFVIRPLSERHGVFAPDWPGFGDSPAPTTPWGIDDYVTFLGRLLDALELERASLAGVSLGGAIALGYALRSPERVEKLVLVDSDGLGQEIPGGRLGYLFVHSPFNELTWALLRRSRSLLRRSLRSIVHDPGMVSEELVDEVYEALQQPGAGSSWLALQRDEVEWDRLCTSYLDRLPELAVRTLIVHGTNDRLVPLAWARRACAVIKQCQLHILEECGHWPPRENPEEFVQAVASFLGDTSDDLGEGENNVAV